MCVTHRNEVIVWLYNILLMDVFSHENIIRRHHLGLHRVLKEVH
jgi:hypothetical protein